MGKNKGKYDFDGSSILSFAIRRYKLLLVITLIAAVVSALASLTIHNRYKSEIVMFPTSQVSISRSIIEENYGTSKGDLMGIGEQEQVDQLLQVLESNEISSRLIKKYNLGEHYKINFKSKGAYTRLYKTLESNIKIGRTEYNSVVVDVWDEDAKIAASMANDIIDLTDTAYNIMFKDNAYKAYKIVKNEFDSITNHIKFLEDSLIKLNKLGIVDYGYQTKEVTQAYYKALSDGKTELAKIIRKQLKVLEDYGAQIVILRDEVAYNQKQQATIAFKLTQVKVEARQNLSRKFVVSRAGVADAKDSPKRMIIVLFSAIATFFAALFFMVIIENIKKIS